MKFSTKLTGLSVIGFIGLLGTIIFSRSITRPFKKLSIAAGEIGKGKLDINTEAGSKDEFGHLEKVFNQMASELKTAETERKNAEEKIRKAAREWQRTFDSITDPVMILDTSHRIIKANKAMSDKIGISTSDAQGLYCYRKVHGLQEPHPECPHSKLLKDGQVHTTEIYEERLGGYFLITVSPVFNDDGSLLGSIHFGVDITERKKAEDEVIRLNEELERKVFERTREIEIAKSAAEAGNRTKTEFIANMSHEIRTPLNAIIGFSEVLFDELYGPLNEKQKEYVNDIIAGSRRLNNLVLNVLDFAKTEEEIQKITKNKFLLRDLLNFAMKMAAEEADKHNLKLSLEIDPESDIEIETDSDKLKQIMFNLLSNAVKFTPDGGSVRVSARTAHGSQLMAHSKTDTDSELSTMNYELNGNFIEISVADTGIGIRPEDFPKLFKEFTQLEAPIRKRYKGAGLGLALTKNLVELLGGKIWAESEFGKGSRFRFVIPIRQNIDSRPKTTDYETELRYNSKKQKQ